MPTVLATQPGNALAQKPDSGSGDTQPTPNAARPAQRGRIDQGRLHSLFLGEQDFYGAIGEERAESVRSQIQTTPNPLRERQRIALTAFLADRTNLPVREVAERYDSLRQSYAQQMFPDMPAIADEGVFHSAVRDQLQNEAQERSLMGEMNRRLFSSAMEGGDFAAAWDGMNIAAVARSGPKADMFNAWAIQRWEANRSTVAKLSPIVDQAADYMSAVRTKENTGTEDHARMRQAVVESVAGLDPEQQSMVWSMAAERAKTAPQGERGVVGKVFGMLSTGASETIDSAVLGLVNSGEAYAALHGLPGPSASMGGAIKRAKADRHLSSILSGEIDPIESDSFAGQVALDFTRATPMMLAAMTGPGLAVDYFALKQNARDNLEAQGAAGADVEAVAALQAIPQTALFFVSSKMIFRGELGGTVLKPAGGLASRIGKTLGIEYAANFALNEAGFLTDAGIQEMASHFSDSIPGVKLDEVIEQFKGRLPQQLAFAIPGALIGTGVATFRNHAAGLRYLQQAAVMDDLGFTQEAQQKVLDAPDYKVAEAAWKEGFETREPDILSDAEGEAMAARERERMLSNPDRDAQPFEALEDQPHPDDAIINPDAPDVPAAPESPGLRVRSELAYVLKEITENEAELGKQTGRKRGKRQKAYEQKLQEWLKNDYVRRLELQAELDVPGARDALVKYQQDVEAANAPTRASRVWEFVRSRKLPTVKALREMGGEAGEIADLDLPKSVFDPEKRIGMDRLGESLLEWLAENGDADAAAMISRGEQFGPGEAAAMIGEAFADFRQREARAARGADAVDVPVIPMPDDLSTALPAVKEVPAAAARPSELSFRTEINQNEISYFALRDGKVVGRATFAVAGKEATPAFVDVPKELQRQGIATAIYNQFVAQHPGVRILNAPHQTPEGQAFRGKYKQPSASVGQRVAEIADLSMEQMQQIVKARKGSGSLADPGGWTGLAYEIGREVRSVDDLNALLRAETEYREQIAQLEPRIKTGKFDPEAFEALQLVGAKAQLMAEAYDKATNSGTAAADPNYRPPIVRNPDGSYTVQAVDGAPAVHAATAEGAAMVEKAQRTEATQQAATAEPVPTPEADGRALPPRITALNKETIAGLRQLFNMDELDAPTRERFIQVLDEAQRTESFRKADELAIDLIASKRVSSAAEHAALVLRSAELQNAYEVKAGEVGEAFARGDVEGAKVLKVAADNFQRQLDTITEASDLSGTAIARALSIRRMRLFRDDYTLARVIQKARTAKQADLTLERQAEFTRLTDQLAEQARVITEQKAALVAADIETARAQAETFVAEGRSRRRTATAEDARNRRHALKRELQDLGMRVNDISGIIGNNVELARIVAKIADTYIEEGVASLTELTNKLKADIPDLSDQDVFMAVGRQTKKEAAKIEGEAKRRVKELRTQAALWAKINAAMEGKREDGSPMNRQQQNKALKQTLAQLRNQANRTTFNDAALKRIDAKISEVQRQIATGERNLRTPEKTTPPSEKLNEAKRTLAELRQEMGALDTIAELETELSTGDFAPGERPDPGAQNSRLQRSRERIAELRDQIEQAQVDPAAVNAERLARLQRLAAELETQMEEGFRPLPERGRSVPDSDSVAAMRKEVRDLETLMRTQDSIADLDDQLRRYAAGETGALKVSVPEQRILSNAAIEAAQIKQKQLRRQIDELIERDRKKTLFEKAVEGLLIPRVLLATADLSGLMRQGLLLGVSRPTTFARTARQSLKAMFDENTADAIALAIERRHHFAEGDRLGLFLSESGGALRTREEHFMSHVAERIPGLGRIIRGSNRAMVTTLNLLRVAAFDGFLDAHPEASVEQKKAYAEYVNAASGRGNVKWSASTVKKANALFFAPRYAVSRFQALYSPLKNANDPIVRNAILKDFGALLGTGLSLMTLAAWAGADVTFDPTDSDFGKIVVDDTRIDLWGGLQQPARLILSIPAGLLKRTEIADLEREVDPLQAGLLFMSYKVSPAISVPRALWTGKNAIGQEQEAPETLVRAVTPLMMQEAFDVLEGTGDVGAAAGAASLIFFGVGVQQHDD